MRYQTICVEQKKDISYIQLYRPEKNNTINNIMIDELNSVVDKASLSSKILVLQGLKDVFCFGADFEEMYKEKRKGGTDTFLMPDKLYELWLKLYTGPFITIADIKGKVNAGGIGFVAASDIAIADETCQFSLSELLFGIYPAIVFPFLVNRIGVQNASYFTLLTKPISSEKAYEYGLIDEWGTDNNTILQRHLRRLSVLSKESIRNFKAYRNMYTKDLLEKQNTAIQSNKEMFSNKNILTNIYRFVEEGVLPWET